jgi:hypothetical protein
MSGGGSNNYDPAKLGNTLGNKLSSYVNTSAPVFNKELYTGQGATTQGALGGILGNANPGGYSGHVTDAIGSFGDMAAGRNIGAEAPGYKAVRDRLSSDVMDSVNSQFTASGRFGGGSHRGELAEQMAGTLGAFDLGEYHRGQDLQFGAASMLPQLYSASQMPGQTQLAVGQLQDADTLAKRQSEADLFDRTKNADYNRFKELLSAFTGSQQNAGMAQETPWWQTALGYVAGNASNALRFF